MSQEKIGAVKVAVYAQHCVMAGQRAWQHEREERWDSSDITAYEGTRDELLSLAAQMRRGCEIERIKRPGADTSFMERVAKTIEEAVR